MVPDVRLEGEFFGALAVLDAEVAGRVAAEGCRHCGGPLHQANYQRKPRGGALAGAGEAFTLRHSLCCGREGCRRRATPPSLRFLGRRVYVEVVVVIASVVAQVSAAIGDARRLTGVPGRTLRRWDCWWRGAFPESTTWQELRARFAPPPPAETDLPQSLLVRVGADLGGERRWPRLNEVCATIAELLAPVTTATVVEAARFVRGIGAQRVVTGATQKMA